jgi:hypothetical protein
VKVRPPQERGSPTHCQSGSSDNYGKIPFEGQCDMASSIDFGLPHIADRSAPALSVSWPAQRSLRLRPTDSPTRLTRPSTPEAPTALLSPPPLRLLPGGAIPFPGGPFIPLWTSAFHGAPLWPYCDSWEDDRSWPTRGEMQARFARGADSSDDRSEVYAGSSSHSG